MTPLRSLECVGGPFDGKRIDYVGPEYKVPLHSLKVTQYKPDIPIVTTDWPRIGIYRKRIDTEGRPAYVWEPTPEVRSLYP